MIQDLTAENFFLTNADGRKEQFGRNVNNNVVHQYEQHPNTGDYTNWFILGEHQEKRAADHLLGCSNADGRLEIFALDGFEMFHIWQVVPNGSWSPWTRIDELAPGTAGGIRIGINPDGRIELFGVGGGRVTHAYQGGGGTGGWSPWFLLNNDPLHINRIDRVAQRNGHLTIWASDDGNTPVYSNQTPNGWSPWTLQLQPD